MVHPLKAADQKRAFLVACPLIPSHIAVFLSAQRRGKAHRRRELFPSTGVAVSWT